MTQHAINYLYPNIKIDSMSFSKFLPILLIAAVVLVAGCTQNGQQATPTPQKATAAPAATSTPQATAASTPTATPQSTPTPVATQAAGAVKTFTNDVTHSGYAFKDSTGAAVSELKVNKGDTVTIKATTTPQAHKHGVAVDAFNVNVEVTAEPRSTPQEISFTADKTGTFELYCKTCLDGAVGAHAWMKANLVVS